MTLSVIMSSPTVPFFRVCVRGNSVAAYPVIWVLIVVMSAAVDVTLSCTIYLIVETSASVAEMAPSEWGYVSIYHFPSTMDY